jgi:hypothetical protein
MISACARDRSHLVGAHGIHIVPAEREMPVQQLVYILKPHPSACDPFHRLTPLGPGDQHIFHPEKVMPPVHATPDMLERRQARTKFTDPDTFHVSFVAACRVVTLSISGCFPDPKGSVMTSFACLG